MKNIKKDELYQNLSQFLKGKGIELKEGQYTKGVHAGCSLLADAINLSQTGLERAKSEFDRQVDQLRQVIHEKTAPKGQAEPASAPRPQAPQAAKPPAPGATKSSRKGAKNQEKATRNRRPRR